MTGYYRDIPFCSLPPAPHSLPSLPGPFFNIVEETCEGNNFRNSGFGL